MIPQDSTSKIQTVSGFKVIYFCWLWFRGGGGCGGGAGGCTTINFS